MVVINAPLLERRKIPLFPRKMKGKFDGKEKKKKKKP